MQKWSHWHGGLVGMKNSRPTDKGETNDIFETARSSVKRSLYNHSG